MYKIATVALGTLLSIQVLAQNSNTSSYKMPTASDGFRVSILRPMLSAKVKAEVNVGGIEASNTDTETIDDTLGFGIGYAHLPVQSFGFVGQLGLLTINGQDGGDDSNLYRVEGNAAYAINENIYFKGGLNFAKFTKGELVKDLDGGIGAQVGVGFQITKNLGLDVTYGNMNFSGDIPVDTGFGDTDVDLEVQLQGVEIGLTGTF